MRSLDLREAGTGVIETHDDCFIANHRDHAWPMFV